MTAYFGQKYVQVEEHYNCDSFGEETQTFRAYINGFGIFAIADNIPDLIKQFEDAKAGIKPKTIDDLDELEF